MSDLKQCHDLLDSTKHLVGVSIDLVDAEIGRLANGELQKLIESKPVQEALTKVLQAEAEALIALQQKGKPLELSLPSFLEKAAKPTGKALSEEYLRSLKQSPHYKRHEDAVSQVIDDFNCSKVGVFVSNNKTVLIIVGAVLAVGGAVGLYFAKTGDFFVGPAEGLGKEIKLGKFKLGGKLVKFEPSKQNVEIDLSIAPPGPFKGAITGTAQGGKWGVSSDGSVLLPAGKGASIDFGYHVSLSSVPLSPSARALVLQGPGDTTIDYKLFVKGKWDYSSNSSAAFSLDATAFVKNNAPGFSLASTYRTVDPHYQFSATAGVELQPRAISARGSLGLNGMIADHPWRLDATGRFGLTPGPSGTAGLLAPRTDLSGMLNLTVYLDRPKKK
jgi:hypothetical protein